MGGSLGQSIGPGEAHKGSANKGPGGPTRARPARAKGAQKGLAHKGPGNPPSPKAQSAPNGLAPLEYSEKAPKGSNPCLTHVRKNIGSSIYSCRMGSNLAEWARISPNGLGSFAERDFNLLSPFSAEWDAEWARFSTEWAGIFPNGLECAGWARNSLNELALGWHLG